MKYFKFKNNDRIPLLGLGTWKSASGDVYDAVREAIKIGYRHIDCASIYENEAEIGMAIKDAIADGEVTREDLWITSKLWNNMHGKNNVIQALKNTLVDLQLDYLDLYLIHWPVPMRKGGALPIKTNPYYTLDEMPVSVTWQGMEQGVELGLTRHIGVSNFSMKKLKDLIAHSKMKPEVNQIELQPYLQQTDMLEFAKRENILLIAYSPLGSKDRSPGMKAKDEPDLMVDPVIIVMAKKIDAAPAQILIAWAINRGTAVIPKSVNAGRIKQNLQASFIELSIEDMSKITKLDRHYRYINGRFWAMPGSPHTYESLWDE